MTEAYLRTSEREDLISSLQLVRFSIKQCEEDLQFWKWILVGTHSSLQAAIVFHLSFGHSLLVARSGHVKRWLKALHSNTEYPEMYMDSFMDLYAKAKTEDVLGFHLVTTESQDTNVKRLVLFRNELLHFMPKAWSIGLAELPGICLQSLTVVRDLAKGPIEGRWEHDAQRARFRSVLAGSIELLMKLDSIYNDT